jgi:membrane-associated phospholipid phosphatase
MSLERVPGQADPAAGGSREAPGTRGATDVATTTATVDVGLLERVRRGIRRLRPEEALFVAGFVPSTIVTLYAYWHQAGRDLPTARVEGGLLRLAVATLLALTIPLIDRARPRWTGWWAGAADFYRTVLPFLLCIAVYTNLHDTVRFVNPNDIHHHLLALEEWIFGGQPVVWAEAYITRGRTEFFNAFYASFFLIGPSAVIVLWASGKRVEAREALLGIIICFYTGYLLYVLFPAAPPRLYMESLGYFHVDIKGGPIANFQEALIRMVPNDASRAAFPSLHAGVSAVSLYYVWRHCRWYFPILLPIVGVLLVSTVYLRHHWVVDLIAGFLLLPWVVWVTPRFERWWTGY